MKKTSKVARLVEAFGTGKSRGPGHPIDCQGPQRSLNTDPSVGRALTGRLGTGVAVQDLLLRYKYSGDPEIAAAIFKQYWHLVLGVCYKYLRDHDLCQDAAMDIFQRVLVCIQKETPTNFGGWLHKVAKNHCLEIHRHEKRFPHFDSLEEARYFQEEEFVNSEAHSQFIALKVHKALGELPENQRTCVELFYLQELSYKEICEECGFTLMMVKSYIQNGKRRLLIALGSLRGSMYRDSDAI